MVARERESCSLRLLHMTEAAAHSKACFARALFGQRTALGPQSPTCREMSERVGELPKAGSKFVRERENTSDEPMLLTNTSHQYFSPLLCSLDPILVSHASSASIRFFPTAIVRWIGHADALCAQRAKCG